MKRFSAYFIGWLSIIAWFIGASSGVSIVAVTISGLVSFWDKTFVGARWMIYLIYLATTMVTCKRRALSRRFVLFYSSVSSSAAISSSEISPENHISGSFHLPFWIRSYIHSRFGNEKELQRLFIHHSVQSWN
jgi:hypothetical protein